MREPYQILLPLLSLFFVRVDLTDLFPLRFPVESLRFLDGDTVDVRSRGRSYRVRLSRIDAPEKGQPYLTGKGDAGADARSCARRVYSPGGELILTGRDHYGRWLGDIGTLSFQLVREGCMGLYPHAQFSSRTEKTAYLVALELAKRERRGLWGREGYLRPQLFRKRNAGRRWRR